MIEFYTLERLSRQICELVRGAGAWDRPKCHRAYWRAKAMRVHLCALLVLRLGART